jgi:type IV pilus assembly protein PilC
MPQFRYVARTTEGESATGLIDAPDQNEVFGRLRKQNLSPVEVQPVSDAGGSRLQRFRSHKAPRPRMKSDDMVVFTRQLATMISAGIPLLECLEVLEQQVTDRGFRFVLANVVERVRSGGDLSDSLSQHRKVFSRLFTNMIKAGEASGQLDIILVRLAEYMEASASLKREIKAAMTYPAVSMVLVTGITIFLMVYIVPQFKQIFDSLGTPEKPIELPWLTQGMLAVSLFTRDYAIYWVSGVVLGILGIIAYRKSEAGQRNFDRLLLRMPIFGPLFRKVAISRFSRTFSTLIKSGVPILGALEIVAATAGNKVIEDAVMRARENVRQGETLATPLASSRVFPPMVTRMIAIGEKSGSLEALLEKISEFYDQQVQATVKSLTSLIEPVLIGVMGVMVGAIVLSIFMPIFDLQSKLAAGV